MNRLKSDIKYNILYQFLVILIPIITVPYTARIFSPQYMGFVGFSQSILQFFIIFSMFGLQNYGIKIISGIKNDKIDNNKNKLLLIECLNLYKIQLLFTIISLIIYIFIVIVFLKDKYQISLLLIQSINIISCLFDISWYYIGIGELKKIIFRNTLVKIVTLLSIILFVKDSDDMYKYLLILSLSVFLGNVFIFKAFYGVILKSKILFYKQEKNKKKHFKVAFLSMLPQFISLIYLSMDKVILNNASNQYEVGMYDQSQKLIRIIIAILAAANIALLPYFTKKLNLNLKHSKNIDLKALITLKKFLSYLILICIFVSIIIFLNSSFLSNTFFGENYLGIDKFIKFSSILLIIVPITMFIGNVILIPLNKEKEIFYSAVLGAIVSVVLNIYLDPKLGALGAVISIIFAEFTVLTYRIIILNNEVQKTNKEAFLKTNDLIYFLITIISTISLSALTKEKLITMQVGNFLVMIITNIVMLASFVFSLTIITLMKKRKEVT